MNPADLKELGAIYLEKITDGFERYTYESRYMGAQEAAKEIGKLWEDREKKDVYVDFYYYYISDESRQKADEVLNEQEKEYLRAGRAKAPREVIFPLDEMLLGIITKLNASEMLFSTIYFTGEEGGRSTWWGNYKEEYIIFSDRGQKRDGNISFKKET